MMVNFSKFFDTDIKFSCGQGIFPRYYGFVVATGIGSWMLNFHLAQNVMKARKEYRVEYPAMYSDNNKFNCIQRAHQSYLENLPSFLFFLLVGGMECPISAAIGGSLFLVGKFVSARGYATGDPEKRRAGMFGYLGGVVLLLSTASFAARHIVASLKSCKGCTKDLTISVRK